LDFCADSIPHLVAAAFVWNITDSERIGACKVLELIKLGSGTGKYLDRTDLRHASLSLFEQLWQFEFLNETGSV